MALSNIINLTPQIDLITEWIPFTMVITANTGTNPTKGTFTELAVWRRVGDSMEISYDFIQTAAGTAGSGTYLFAIPPGYTIDSSKTTLAMDIHNSYCGSGHATANSDASTTGFIVAAYDTTHFGLLDPVGGNPIETGYFDLANGSTKYSFNAVVPIVEFAIS